MGFKSRVAITTGGESGIGEACSRLFAEHTPQVAVVGVNEKAVGTDEASFVTRAAFFVEGRMMAG